MATTTIYYGAPPKSAQQTVSEALRLQGINLLRSEPAKVIPDGIRLIFSPQYDIYKSHLAAALEATTTPGEGVAVGDQSEVYHALKSKTNLEGAERMRIVWDYIDTEPQPDQTALDAMKTRYQPSELTIQGKPAFMADLNVTQLGSLMQTGARRTTPCISNTINIASALALVKIQRLFRAYLAMHQYPLSADSQHADALKNIFGIGRSQTTFQVHI